MKEAFQAVAATAVLGTLAACASQVDHARTDGAPAEPAVKHASPAANPTGSVIGVVQLRDERMTIHSTPDGVRFTVATRDGAVLGRGLSPTELAARHEVLYRVYRSGYAANEPYVDARLDNAVIESAETPDLPR